MKEPMCTQLTPTEQDVLTTKQLRKFLHVPYVRLYGWWRRGGGPIRTGSKNPDGTTWTVVIGDVDDWLSKCWLGLKDERLKTWMLHPQRTLLSLTDLSIANKMSVTNFKTLIGMIRNPLVYKVNHTYLFDPRDAMSWASVVAQLRISLGYGIDTPWEDIQL